MKKNLRIEYKSWFILYDVAYRYIYKCYYSLKYFVMGKRKCLMKMNSKDFILVLNLCLCTAPLNGGRCILTSFKHTVHSI